MRRRILDVAAEAFQARGYHATSTHDIMHAAGVTGGALHHHFPSKKALALAVIRERVAAAVRETWIEPIQAAPTARDGVLAVFGRTARELDERRRVLGCPVNNLAIELALADAELRQALQDVFAEWQAAILRKLRADQETGAVGPADPDAMAAFVVMSFSGAMALAKTRQSTEPLETCARQLKAMLGGDAAGAAPDPAAA
ncbi:MAG: TetR/AcrR family transcriptional regulator [Alphaproteobacteria bacterium]|nr:TetR/AcrR family transcriptional regulator [Alphaproteobacteria bacterium]